MVEGQEDVSWEQWVALAQAAEEARLDGLFRSDHLRSIVRGDPAGSLDAWGTLAGLAAITQTIRLGTLVSPATFRRVSILAKLVTTVDHISNGRVELGLGAGWYESEHHAYGLDFMTTRERLDELDRQLAEVTRQWTEADDIWPKPIQQPRPPISGTVDQVVDQLREYERAGVERVMLQHLAHEDAEMVTVLGEVAARLP